MAAQDAEKKMQKLTQRTEKAQRQEAAADKVSNLEHDCIKDSHRGHAQGLDGRARPRTGTTRTRRRRRRRLPSARAARRTSSSAAKKGAKDRPRASSHACKAERKENEMR